MSKAKLAKKPNTFSNRGKPRTSAPIATKAARGKKPIQSKNWANASNKVKASNAKAKKTPEPKWTKKFQAVAAKLKAKAHGGLSMASVQAATPFAFHQMLTEQLKKNGEKYKTSAEKENNSEKLTFIVSAGFRGIMAGTIVGALPEDIQRGISNEIAKLSVETATLTGTLLNDPSIILKLPLTMSDQLINGLIGPICDTIALEGDAVAFQKYVVNPCNNLCDTVSHSSREELAGMATGLLLTANPMGAGKKAVKKGVKETVEKTAKDDAMDVVKKKPVEEKPFDANGKLKPNIRYKAGEFDYYYETDDLGRICKWETDELQFTQREKRLNHDSKTPGKIPGDHAGHLAGDRFGGSPALDNLVSQLQNVNLSQYKKLENKWGRALKEGKRVTVQVDIKYTGGGLRPTKFIVFYTIDGKSFSKTILN